MFQLFLFLVIVVLCLLIWITRSPHEVNHIPGPAVYPIIGNLPDLIQIIRLGVIDYLLERREKYGPIFRLNFVGKNFIFISEPNYIKTVLTSSENLHRPAFAKMFESWTGKGVSTTTGALWHKQRKLLEPALSNSKIRLVIPRIVERCEIMCHELRHFDGAEINLLTVMRELSVKLAYDNFLNTTFDEVKQKEVADTTAEILYLMLSRMVRPWVWKDSFYSLTKNASKENVLAKKLRRITLEAISSRKNRSNEKLESENRNTLVDYLIERQKEDASLSDEDIRIHVDTMITSAMNTLPLGISIVLYFVASYDSVQDNIRQELNSVFPEPMSSKRLPTMEELSQLKYLEAVINESLRFSKPPPAAGRSLSKELFIGQYRIPAGSAVLVHSSPLHHDKKYYSKPDEFNPEHFNPEEVERRPLYAFLPFGRSLRSCIAERYTRMCMKLVIGSIIQNYRVKSSQTLEVLAQAQLRGMTDPRNTSHSIFMKLKII